MKLNKREKQDFQYLMFALDDEGIFKVIQLLSTDQPGIPKERKEEIKQKAVFLLGEIEAIENEIRSIADQNGIEHANTPE